MESNIMKYQKDLESLLDHGQLLLYGLYNELSKTLEIDDELKNKIKGLSFKKEYNSWYNEALAVIRQLLPDRLNDFIAYYKLDKKKEITHETYTISDYLIGIIEVKKGYQIVVDTKAVVFKFQQQKSIVDSLKDRFNSSLFDIKQLVQADMFDSEIDAAKELNKKGFQRAAGAICGVVIEKHLHGVCETRGIAITKKNPAINDYNELLKNNDVIDTPTWRLIQRLADLRNLCDHNKTEEPTKENINDLIDGTDKIIKTIF